jgi:hypothetical protein
MAGLTARGIDRIREKQNDNVLCAKIILASPERYAGLPTVWAESILAKSRAERIEQRVLTPIAVSEKKGQAAFDFGGSNAKT